MPDALCSHCEHLLRCSGLIQDLKRTAPWSGLHPGQWYALPMGFHYLGKNDLSCKPVGNCGRWIPHTSQHEGDSVGVWLESQTNASKSPVDWCGLLVLWFARQHRFHDRNIYLSAFYLETCARFTTGLRRVFCVRSWSGRHIYKLWLDNSAEVG